MKKMKKIFAMLMALTMVLGMSTTAFATAQQPSDNGKIIITNFTKGDTTTVTVYQLATIEKQDNGTWGWNWSKINDVSIADTYFEVSDSNYTFKKDKDGNMLLTKDVIRNGLTPVASPSTTTEQTIEIEGLKAGLYAIIANGTKDGKDSTTYNLMVAETYEYNSDGLLVTKEETINAKGESYTITKTLANDDGKQALAGIGDTRTFVISMPFPSFDVDEKENRVFYIDDTPTDMTINDVVEVKVGGVAATKNTDYTVTKETSNSNGIRVTFTSAYLTDARATQTIEVKVTGTITGPNPSNKANSNKSGDSNTETVTTGTITIDKYNADSTATPKEQLKDAEFEISLDGATLKFERDDEGVYTLSTAEKASSTLSTTFNNEYKQITLKGLKAGTYTLKETKAPEGYSINENIGNDVTLEVDGEGNVVSTGTFEVADTHQSSLPSTGGIGTTIFTIGGCLIMIIAAGLFFASRRKTNK